MAPETRGASYPEPCGPSSHSSSSPLLARSDWTGAAADLGWPFMGILATSECNLTWKDELISLLKREPVSLELEQSETEWKCQWAMDPTAVQSCKCWVGAMMYLYMLYSPQEVGPRVYLGGNGKEGRKGSKWVKHIPTAGNWSFILLGNSESQGRMCTSELS